MNEEIGNPFKSHHAEFLRSEETPAVKIMSAKISLIPDCDQTLYDVHLTERFVYLFQNKTLNGNSVKQLATLGWKMNDPIIVWGRYIYPLELLICNCDLNAIKLLVQYGARTDLHIGGNPFEITFFAAFYRGQLTAINTLRIVDFFLNLGIPRLVRSSFVRPEIVEMAKSLPALIKRIRMLTFVN